MKDFLRIADLSAADLTHLLDLADACERHPYDHLGKLEGDGVVCYFAKPSTRTRLSFATAIARLGGSSQIVNGDELQLGRGETIADTARVVSRYARAFVIRTYQHAEIEAFAAAADVPVVNALTDLHHPCQALADLQTLRQRFGGLAGLKLAYVGDGNNVCHSLIEACALASMEIDVATPISHQPDHRIVDAARQVAHDHGGTVRLIHDADEAVSGADVVYTDTWLSMGDDEASCDARIQALTPFRVDGLLMSAASPTAVFMHCLPAHRGEEVTDEVIDGPQSVVFEQAGHRLHTAQAVLLALLNGSLQGAGDGHMTHREPARVG